MGCSLPRREFSTKIKAAAALRADDHCEGCTARLRDGQFHYDHEIPDALGGDPTLENCRVLCRSCHSAKTTGDDVPRIAKAKRNYNKARGIKKQSSFRGWRKMNGDVVWRK